MHILKIVYIKTFKIAPTCFDPKIIFRELHCSSLKCDFSDERCSSLKIFESKHVGAILTLWRRNYFFF